MTNKYNNTWIIVANGSTGKILCKNNSDCPLQIVEQFESKIAHLRSRDLATDAPGRVFESASVLRHAAEPRLDPHFKEKLKFADKMAKFLNTAANVGKFAHLILVASPEFLGILRAKLTPHVCSLIKNEINKDLTHLSIEQVADYLYIC
jgi:protein required for attachment to host cells